MISVYDLSESRREAFFKLLQVNEDANFQKLKIGCVAWSESSCVAAGKFLVLLSQAGWEIEGGQVYKMEPSIPVNGMSIAARNDSTSSLPTLPPHLGRWAVMSDGGVLLTAAFKYMDSSVHSTSDPSLGDHVLGVYFGPDAPTQPSMELKDKNLRMPLIDYFKTSVLLERQCLVLPDGACTVRVAALLDQVQRYLADGKLGQAAISQWKNLMAEFGEPTHTDLVKARNFLAQMFLLTS
ncbi:hypothetical protein [Pseudomonas quasicaspiana]|uniref:hypothetical protein n=1 Tax=Pseudomonas quasicaspiana TaxID=2829821 RepID=UPI001E429CD6|nr:hypothetical protein [Pseudomonas quasicaspiana]MCD5976755.1 hypothetical protein [Pseudomonas quasicaspiana]